MATGLILLAFLAGLVSLGFARARRRLGMGVTSRHWIYAFVGTFLVILLIWASSHT